MNRLPTPQQQAPDHAGPGAFSTRQRLHARWSPGPEASCTKHGQPGNQHEPTSCRPKWEACHPITFTDPSEQCSAEPAARIKGQRTPHQAQHGSRAPPANPPQTTRTAAANTLYGTTKNLTHTTTANRTPKGGGGVSGVHVSSCCTPPSVLLPSCFLQFLSLSGPAARSLFSAVLLSQPE